MIRRAILTITLCVFTLFASTLPVAAFDIFGGSPCTGTQTTETHADQSAVCGSKTGSDPLTGNGGTLDSITNIIAIVAGMAAVIMIVVGAINFMTAGSEGNANARVQKINTARSSITNALIGLVIIVLARSIILYVLNKLK